MKLISFMPCEDVKSTEYGPILEGFFRRFYSESLPEKISFSALIEVEEFDAYKFNRLGVDMVSPSGETVFKRGIPLSFPFEDIEDGTLADFALGIEFEDVEITEEGQYLFIVVALSNSEREAVKIGTSHLNVEADEDVSESNEEM